MRCWSLVGREQQVHSARDMQDQDVEAHGKTIVDVRSSGDATQSCVVDYVSNVGREVASQITGFDIHFTKCGHTRWLEEAGERTAFMKMTSTQLLHWMHFAWGVLPPPGSANRELAMCKKSKKAWSDGCAPELSQGQCRAACL